MAKSPDPFAKLLEQRSIAIVQPIFDDLANVVIAQILYLRHQDPTEQILIYISSPGGQISAALAIRDTMDLPGAPIVTIVTGQAYGAAILVSAHGVRGERVALPGARITLCATVDSRARVMPDHAAQLARTNALTAELIASDTGQSVAQVAEDMRANREFDAEAARAYGLVDQVITPKRSPPK
jgi:ATP-dependent Clp protease protease subunit